MNKRRLFILLVGVMLGLLCLHIPPVFSKTLTATAVASDTNVFVGEPFTFQIQVSGSESPEKPDLSNIDGFNVVFQGGSQNSSSSITIINGQMTKNVHEGYVFSYQMTPTREGRLTIPPVTITANGQTARTRPVDIQAQKPAETNNSKLRMQLSNNRCYVGEPVTLTVTWYINSDVQNANLTLPFMEKQDWFYIETPKVDTSSGGKFFKIPAGKGNVIVEKGEGSIDGQSFATLTFKKVLIPKKSGTITLDPATISCQALVGYRRQKNPFGNDLFSNFFNNNSGFGRRGIYRQTVVPSNSLKLDIMDVPLQGRPADFSGLVGQYHIDASAKPTSVSVGDPITLTVDISGPEYLDPVELPPLDKQPAFAAKFKIPDERSIGEISGNKKIFTQTIRPLNPGVKEIPSIRLSYFDTRSESYKIAETKPIPLSVKPTRIVTAQDAEGLSAPTPAGQDVKTYAAGISQNYDGPDVVINQIRDPLLWVRSPEGMGILVIPPVLYLLLFAGSALYRRRKSDPLAVKKKKAGAQLAKAINGAKHAKTPQDAKIQVLDGFKAYLGYKLRMPAGALTFNDVRGPLEKNKADQTTLDQLKNLFADCEAARYGSTENGDTIDRITDQSLDLTKKLEKLLK